MAFMRRKGCGCFGLILGIIMVAGILLIVSQLNPDADFMPFISKWAQRFSDAWQAAWQILSAP